MGLQGKDSLAGFIHLFREQASAEHRIDQYLHLGPYCTCFEPEGVGRQAADVLLVNGGKVIRIGRIKLPRNYGVSSHALARVVYPGNATGHQNGNLLSNQPVGSA